MMIQYATKDFSPLSFELWGLNFELYDMNYELRELRELHEFFSNKDSCN